MLWRFLEWCKCTRMQLWCCLVTASQAACCTPEEEAALLWVPVFNVLSSHVDWCWNDTLLQYLTVFLSLFRSGRMKERTVFSHQTSVSLCGLWLFYSNEKCSFNHLFPKTYTHPSILFLLYRRRALVTLQACSLTSTWSLWPTVRGMEKNAAIQIKDQTPGCLN